MADASSFISRLLTQEVKRVVARARSRGHVFPAQAAAGQILATYPNCGLDAADVANEVMLEAARAGLAVEIGRQGDPASVTIWGETRVTLPEGDLDHGVR